MTTPITTTDAKEKFSELLNHVSHHKEQFILTRNGRDIAAIVPVEDFTLLQEMKNKIILQEALESLKQARQEGAIPLEKLKTEIGS